MPDKLELNFRELARDAAQYVFGSTFPSLERLLKTIQTTSQENRDEVENLDSTLSDISSRLNDINTGLRKLNSSMSKSLGLLGKILDSAQQQQGDASTTSGGAGNVITKSAISNIGKTATAVGVSGAMFQVINNQNTAPPAPESGSGQSSDGSRPQPTSSVSATQPAGSRPPASSSGSGSSASPMASPPAAGAPAATPEPSQPETSGNSLLIKANTITFDANEIVFPGGGMGGGLGGGAPRAGGRQGSATPVGMRESVASTSAGIPAGGGNAGAAVDAASRLSGASITGNYGDIVNYLRTGGIGLDPSKEAWCAAFVNSSLAQAGIRGSGSQLANSFQRWGVPVRPTEVRKGDVVLLTRGKGPGQPGGHVGLATGNRSGDGIEIIAGNTSRAVKTYSVPLTSQLVVRRSPDANMKSDDLQIGDAPGQVAKAQTGSSTTGDQASKESAASPVGASPAATPVQKDTKKTDVASRDTTPKTTVATGAELNRESTNSEMTSITPPPRATMNNIKASESSNPQSFPNPKLGNSNHAGNVEPEDATQRYEALFGIKPRVPTGSNSKAA